MSFPCKCAQQAVLRIFAIVLYLGFPGTVVEIVFRKHARRYPAVYSAKIKTVAHQAIVRQGRAGAVYLVGVLEDE